LQSTSNPTTRRRPRRSPATLQRTSETPQRCTQYQMARSMVRFAGHDAKLSVCEGCLCACVRACARGESRVSAALFGVVIRCRISGRVALTGYAFALSCRRALYASAPSPFTNSTSSWTSPPANHAWMLQLVPRRWIGESGDHAEVRHPRHSCSGHSVQQWSNVHRVGHQASHGHARLCHCTTLPISGGHWSIVV
jgi:hypothetical protein